MEVKTIQQIKDEVAVKHGYENFEQIRTAIDCNYKTGNSVEEIMDDVAKSWGYQQCELQKGQCADEAKLLLHDGRTKKDKTLSSKIYMIGADHLKVSEQSILTAKNVCDERI